MGQLPHYVLNLSNGDRLGFVRIPGKTPELLVVGGYGKSALEKPIGACTLNYALQRGQACTVLEFRGQGRSTMLPNGMAVPGMRDDLIAASVALGLRGCLGIGASLGAWAMLAAQQQNTGILWGMLALAPAIDWDLTYFKPLSERGALVANAAGQIQVPESGIVVGREFFDGLGTCRIDGAAAAIPGVVRVIHGDSDAIAPAERSQRLALELGGDLTILPGAGHEVSALQSQQSQEAFVQQCDLILMKVAQNAQ